MGLRSLRSLTLAFLLVFLVATVGTGLATYSATRTTITRLVDERIELASTTVMGLPDARAPDEILGRIALFAKQRDTGDIGFALVDASGRRLGGNVVLRRRLPPGYASLHADDRIRGLSAGRALVRDVGGGVMLTTIAETEPFDNYNAARARIYLFGFGSIVFIVVGGMIFFVVTISRRIAEMRHTVEAIIDGDMQRRVPVDGSGGEFAQQAQAFNRMLDRIADLMAGISNVSNDIAHDLRTPLARLRGQLALLLARAPAPAQREGLEAAIAQSDELLAMFAAVLRIAEVEGGDRRAGFAPLDLGDLARDVGTMMQPVAEEAGHRLVVGTCVPAPVAGDRQLLAQLLNNLIENGLRHTPDGSSIAIETRRSGTEAVLTVTDDGPGIAPARRAQAMRRFGRLETERGHAGHGLGLPLVEAIVRLHRGSIVLEDAAPGLRVIVAVPLA